LTGAIKFVLLFFNQPDFVWLRKGDDFRFVPKRNENCNQMLFR